MTGILAIWNDCVEGHEDAYESWYQDEHLYERVGLQGFLSGSRYEAIDAPRQFLTTYEVESPAVLKSKTYLERLDNPTERTARIMSGPFINMCRTVCLRRKSEGGIRGSIALTAMVFATEHQSELERLHHLASTMPKVVHFEDWVAAGETQPVRREEQIRGGDQQIAACAVFEFLRPEDGMNAIKMLRSAFPASETGLYRHLCTLRKEDLQ